MRYWMAVVGLVWALSAQGQVTVFDPADYVYDILSQIQSEQQLAEMISLLREAERRYQQLQRLEDRVSGVRDWGDLLNDYYFQREVRRYTPDSWDEFIRAVDDVVGPGGLEWGRVLRKVEDIYRIPGSEVIFADGESHEMDEVYDLQRREGLGMKAAAETAYNLIDDRMEATEVILGKLSASGDLKDSSDANVRATTLVAETLAEQVRLQAMALQSAGSAALSETQERAMILQALSFSRRQLPPIPGD